MSDRAWATKAHEIVARVASSDAGAAKNFRTQCMNSPVLVRQAGALQAVAFWRRTAEGKEFSDCVAEIRGDRDGAGLLDALAKLPDGEYVDASRKLVRIVGWLRRFAQAEL
jgi:CRISPR/Cas system CMR-associated protein Cmr5 small subunit